jgi:hypothetical protein
MTTALPSPRIDVTEQRQDWSDETESAVGACAGGAVTGRNSWQCQRGAAGLVS